jgi:hypothetical protein
MNYEITEETLEEGRVALYQLEKQLKERGNNILSDTVSESSSNKLNTSTQERKILDQKPRVERLNHRLESLGLTVEVRVRILVTVYNSYSSNKYVFFN